MLSMTSAYLRQHPANVSNRSFHPWHWIIRMGFVFQGDMILILDANQRFENAGYIDSAFAHLNRFGICRRRGLILHMKIIKPTCALFDGGNRVISIPNRMAHIHANAH